MIGTAIVTSSASDLTTELAASRGIIVVPSIVTFGHDEFQAGPDLSIDDFWARMLAPNAVYPITAPPSPGAFRDCYEAAFEAGADAIVSVQMSARMSATFDSARVAAEMFQGREILLVDTGLASMGTGLLVLMGAEMSALGVSAAEIAGALARRARDVHLFAALDTLAYLRKGGRISAAAARIGAFLSVKPLITIADGQVEVVGRVATRREARERVIKLLTERPAERLAILYSPPADAIGFRDEVVSRMPGHLDVSHVTICPLGPTIGPHIGPGCLGGAVLRS
jgi:DegV family protein with EDD domain